MDKTEYITREEVKMSHCKGCGRYGEWTETAGIFGHKEKCSRCGKIVRGTYSDPSFDCPKYCPECGARMKNPHYHFVEIDYGD